MVIVTTVAPERAITIPNDRPSPKPYSLSSKEGQEHPEDVDNVQEQQDRGQDVFLRSQFVLAPTHDHLDIYGQKLNGDNECGGSIREEYLCSLLMNKGQNFNPFIFACTSTKYIRLFSPAYAAFFLCNPFVFLITEQYSPPLPNIGNFVSAKVHGKNRLPTISKYTLDIAFTNFQCRNFFILHSFIQNIHFKIWGGALFVN